MTQSDYVSPEDIAEHYGVSTETVRRWCRENRVPSAFQLGCQWRIPRRWMTERLEILLDNGRDEAHKL